MHQINVLKADATVDGLLRIARQEGIKGLYRGLIPSLFGVTHGAFQFTAYEKLKNRRASKNPNTPAVSAMRRL